MGDVKRASRFDENIKRLEKERSALSLFRRESLSKTTRLASHEFDVEVFYDPVFFFFFSFIYIFLLSFGKRIITLISN